MITLYGIRNCDTMKKAMAWLDAREVDYHFHDYRKDGVPEARFRHWVSVLGWETVINRRSTTWRKLDQKVRDTMTADSALEQARSNPSLIKRPILDTGSALHVGFREADWKTLI